MYADPDPDLALTPPKNLMAPWGSPPWLNQPCAIALEQLNHWVGDKPGAKPVPSHGYRFQIITSGGFDLCVPGDATRGKCGVGPTVAPALRGQACPPCGKPACSCSDVSQLVATVRNTTRALRPLVEKGVLRGFDVRATISAATHFIAPHHV